MIPLPPHRTKRPSVLGATGPGETGPFGRWPEPDETTEKEQDDAGGPHG